MAKNLVIVESPAKVKTISKFLGKDYTIEASMGHLIDLPKSSLGIDIENNFEPKYITIRGKGKLLQKLKSKAKAADNVFLATDPDREGETISWHLRNAFGLKDNNSIKRVTFNEITKNAVTKAIENPRDIDMNLVDSQQARRVMDRIVGYQISPIIWEKIKRGLSAGRVQSVALRLINDREKEINDFIPTEYWTFGALLSTNRHMELLVNFYGKDGKKVSINNEKELNEIINSIDKKFKVVDIKNSKREKKSPLPFTTSTLQQEAGKALNFTVAKTMRVAQKLYEGVDIPQRGTTALITYLRTDSTRVSDEAKKAAKDYIEENFGSTYLIDENNVKEKEQSNKIQDAHEAIRPTYLDLTPQNIKDSLTKDEYKLYQLIFKRFLASRMKNAIYDTQKLTIDSNGWTFTANASKVNFLGYMIVYRSEEDEDEAKTRKLPLLNLNDELELIEYKKEQHFTEPKPHFTESSLVKVLEEDGIGRPSTYAPTINTLLKRRYITKEKKNIFITELGMAVNDLMVKGFSDIVDEKFTANMEKNLDDVETGAITWKEVLKEFYPKFKEELDNAEKTLEKITIKEEVTDEKCDNCGANLIVKYGPYGKFLACPNFPDCKFTKTYIERTGVVCPECKSAELVKLRSKKGRIFYGCENKDCSYMCWKLPNEENNNIENK